MKAVAASVSRDNGVSLLVLQDRSAPHCACVALTAPLPDKWHSTDACRQHGGQLSMAKYPATDCSPGSRQQDIRSPWGHSLAMTADWRQPGGVSGRCHIRHKAEAAHDEHVRGHSDHRLQGAEPAGAELRPLQFKRRLKKPVWSWKSRWLPMDTPCMARQLVSLSSIA